MLLYLAPERVTRLDPSAVGAPAPAWARREARQLVRGLAARGFTVDEAEVLAALCRAVGASSRELRPNGRDS